MRVGRDGVSSSAVRDGVQEGIKAAGIVDCLFEPQSGFLIAKSGVVVCEVAVLSGDGVFIGWCGGESENERESGAGNEGDQPGRRE